MNSTVFWHVTPCGAVEVRRSFGGKKILHLQDKRHVKETRGMKKVAG
jgi:hypothetical protein